MRSWQMMVVVPAMLWARAATAGDVLYMLPVGPDLANYQSVELADLKSSLFSYDGKAISVRGTMKAENGIVVLQNGKFDKAGVVMDVDRLPDDVKRTMRFRCVPFCTALIYAKVGQSTLGESLIATYASVQ